MWPSWACRSGDKDCAGWCYRNSLIFKGFKNSAGLGLEPLVALEHVEGLVLDLPPGAAARGQFSDTVRGDWQIGDEGIVVGALARTVEDFDGEPGDGNGIGGAAQRNFGEPAVDVSDPFAALANGLTMLLELDAGEIFSDGLMRAWLAGQDEVAAALLDDAHDRLAGIEIVATIDRPETGDTGLMAGQPALGGGPFAILFFRPVLRRDELGRQRQDPGVTGRDHTGAEKGVEILHAAIRAPARRALRTADLARTEVLGAVERDQQSAVQALERRQAIGGSNALQPLDEQPVEGGGRTAVEHLADVVVARDGGRCAKGASGA